MKNGNLYKKRRCKIHLDKGTVAQLSGGNAGLTQTTTATHGARSQYKNQQLAACEPSPIQGPPAIDKRHYRIPCTPTISRYN